ncbi:PREDICTED: microtubule-binding protein TANGLED isoform X2 [Tarenaya hassleriana]|nr:PREDICTED: microtubule-binding protein TANGLED isoform X2 [Tarenaya hassleriana]
MERLQELQYTVSGGTKIVSGVSLSPRSTRTYLKTSLRCKQETLRIKNATSRKSPVGKFPASSAGDWRRTSLPAMLLGETVNEILQASQFTREIVEAVASKKNKQHKRSILSENGPKTPEAERKTPQPNHETTNSDIRLRRKKEKQNKLQLIRSESDSPSLQRARSRIAFKIVSPHKIAEKDHPDKGNGNNSFRHSANRVSPKHKPWAKKTVLFPNPLFTSMSSSTHQAKFCRTRSPVIVKNDISSSSNCARTQTPHKFLIKSPPTPPSKKFQVKIKSPPKVTISPKRTSSSIKKSPKSSLSPTRIANLGKMSPPKASISPTRVGNFSRKSPKLSTAAKLRRSLSPARLATRLVSPLKSRKSVGKSNETTTMYGLKQRPVSVPKRFSMGRI